MGGAAGHGGLASAPSGAADQGTKTFLDLGAAYRHVASGLTAAAGTYTQTEQDLVTRSKDILRGHRVNGTIVMPGGDPAVLEQMAAQLETAARQAAAPDGSWRLSNRPEGISRPLWGDGGVAFGHGGSAAGFFESYL